jgi:hypothetical protein
MIQNLKDRRRHLNYEDFAGFAGKMLKHFHALESHEIDDNDGKKMIIIVKGLV